MSVLFKNHIKNLMITLILFTLFFSLASLLIMYQDIPHQKLCYLSYTCFGLMSLICGIMNAKKEKPILYLIPLFLINIIIMIVFHKVSHHFIITIICELIPFLVIVVFAHKKNTHKKRNMNRIRRDYEKLRKK